MQQKASASVNGARGLPTERPGRPYNVHIPLPSTGFTELALAHAGLAVLWQVTISAESLLQMRSLRLFTAVSDLILLFKRSL